MPPEILKVCGLTRAEDALNAVRSGATAVGMVFYAKSPRAATAKQAAAICKAVGAQAAKVGVFVNEAPEVIREAAKRIGLDVVQLHGDENPEECAVFPSLRVWKALRVTADFRPADVAAYPVEAVLLDADAGSSYGGAGTPFPWEKAAKASRFKKIIVAGGLDGSNVADAIRASNPWGVDSSSQLESAPGVKDPEKVRRYLQAAKSVK